MLIARDGHFAPKQYLVALAGVTAAALLVAACGSTGTPSSGGASSSAPSAGATSALGAPHAAKGAAVNVNDAVNQRRSSGS